MKLEHFSHEHPLTLVKQTSDKGEVVQTRQHNLRCFGCAEKITSGVPYYRCKEKQQEKEDCCFFCLHQACADMPMTTDLPSHNPDCVGEGELVKYLRRDHHSDHTCGVCERSCYRLAYECSECTDVMCFRCAVEAEREIVMPCHQHPVRLFETAQDLPCSVCRGSLRTRTGGEEVVQCYNCKYCDYIAHPDCTDVPLKVESPSHPEHPLQLRQFVDPVTCRICIQVIDHTKELGYSCVKCEYNTHVYDYSSTSS